MELLEAIQSRRSIRKFKPDAIPAGYISELIEAGRLAPSGTNLQPTRYVVIKSAVAREKLKECTPLPFIADAPIVIACCIDTTSVISTGDRIKELREAQAFAGTPLEKETNQYSNDNKRRDVIDGAALKAYLNLNALLPLTI